MGDNRKELVFFCIEKMKFFFLKPDLFFYFFSLGDVLVESQVKFLVVNGDKTYSVA